MSLTVSDIELYYDSMRGDSLANYKTYQANRKNLLAFFGDTLPGDIGPAECDEYADMRREGKLGRPAGDGTVRRELGVLMTICRYALKHRQIATADLPSIERPAPPLPRDRWLTEEEICHLMQTARKLRSGSRVSRVERFLWLALLTAARYDSIRTLRWDQIAWTSPPVIHFNPAGRRQTRKRRASVPMSKELLLIMKAAWDERLNDHWVLDNSKDVRGDLKRVFEAAGLQKVTPHALRHTAATHMAKRGVPLWQIAGVLGNSVKMVEQVYAHHCPTHLQEAVGAVPVPQLGDLL